MITSGVISTRSEVQHFLADRLLIEMIYMNDRIYYI